MYGTGIRVFIYKRMNSDGSPSAYDYTSMKYWDERYAADETVYEWHVVLNYTNMQGYGLQSV